MANPEAIKARLAQKGIGGTAVQEMPGRPLVSNPKPPVVGTETVKAACGHEVPFELFEEKRDKFRSERRKKVTDRACAACRERKRLEEEEAAKARRAEKQQGAKEAAAGAPGSRKPLGWIAERLPDGARFNVVYDASGQRWSGTLTIGEKSFTDSSSAVFKLLRKLDRQFRESGPSEPTTTRG